MSDIWREIAANKISSCYFLCGESYLVERAATAIKDAVLPDGANDFNCELLTADESRAQGILDAARTMPMLGGRRLVMVRQLQNLKADELAKLLPYLRDPSPSCCLVLIADQVDTRLKFFAEIKKLGLLTKFEPLKERQAPSWLEEEAKRLKIKLAPGAAARIVDAVGTELAQLIDALERVSLFVGLGNPVTIEGVEEVLSQSRQRSIFELTGAVGKGERADALIILRRMLEEQRREREEGIRIVAMLARHIRQLWQARELSRQGSAQQQIAEQVGIPPFFVKDMVEQASRFSAKDYPRLHRALFEADRRLKSSPLTDRIILEQLIFSLTEPKSSSKKR